MSEIKRDFIYISNAVAWPSAAFIFWVVAMRIPDYTGYWLPTLIAGSVLVFVTFGLNKLLQVVGGVGGFALAAMSTVSFVVAVLQLIIWYQDWPFKH